MIDIAQCAAYLRHFNEWRRGDERLNMPEPKEIGRQIDFACEVLEAMAAHDHLMVIAAIATGDQWGITQSQGAGRLRTVPLERRVMRRETTEKENMATKYPQYQIGTWIDTSEEAMNKPQATMLYGVRIKPEKGAKWMHFCRGSEPLIYQTPEEASAVIAELKAADAVAC